MRTLFLTTAAFAALVMIAPIGKAQAANEQNRCVAEFDAADALFPDQPSHHAQNVAQCHAIWGPDSDFASPVAPAAYNAPAQAAPSTRTRVAITGEGMGGLQSVNVTTGSTTTSMFVDSGCATTSITAALADKLIANGEAVDVRSPALIVACEPCGWRGTYNAARLMEQHGDAKLTDLLQTLRQLPEGALDQHP
jgi:hypothetical protein